MLDQRSPVRLLDHHPDYFLDTFLRGICLKIQPTETMIERFETAYKVVEEILRAAPEGSIIHQIDLKVFVQGSLLSNTVVKPIHRDEYDLDVVILFKLDHREVNPRAVQDEIYKLLKADARYSDKVEKKSRCVTIQYKTAFHIDLMPALPEFLDFEDNWILVPRKKSENLFDWQSSNPIDLNEWLAEVERLFKLDSAQRFMLKEASVEVSPFPRPSKYKSNIRYIIELLKRARDQYFKDDPDSKKIARSIALLVLTGTHYQPQGGSLIVELRFVVEKILEATSDFLELHVYNPLHHDRDKEHREDFAEKWRQNRGRYLKFREWVTALSNDLDDLYLMRDASYNQYVEKLKQLFHDTPVNDLLNEYGDNTKKLQNANKLKVSGTTGTVLAGASATAFGSVPKASSFGDSISSKMFCCERVDKKLPLYAQIERVRVDFPNFKMSFAHGHKKRNVVRWVGEVHPEKFGQKYKIAITYKDGYHPVVEILSHDVAHGPHLYPGKKLCLYHPYDGDGRWKSDEPISKKIIPLTILWLVQWQIWKVTGKWNGDEHPHGNPSDLVRAS